MIDRVEAQPGSTGEVCGDTRLRTGDGTFITIAEVVERLHRGSNPRIRAVDENGRLAMVEVHFARRIGDDAPITELTTDQGGHLHASASQLVLSATGVWVSLGELSAGDRLAFAATGHDRLGSDTCEVVSVGRSPTRAVYEFSIRGLHNAISAGGLIVHD